MSYFDTLYTASYNGATFFVRRSGGEFGRRLAPHKYPYRDQIWSEDMGKRPREFEIDGFIIGDDVAAQRDWFVTVCELPGPGVLIHPTMGIQQVTLLHFRTHESMEHGREIKLSFKFIEAGERLFPVISLGSADNTQTAADNVGSASSASFIDTIGSALAVGAQVATRAAVTVSTLVAVGGALAKNAGNVAAAARALPGPFGRTAAGATGSAAGSIAGSISSVGGVAAQVSALLAGAATARAALSTAGSSLTSIAGNL